MVAEGARERRSKLAVQERASKGRERGGDATPEQAEQRKRLSVNVSDKRPKRDTRAEVAREAKIPERKLRAAAEVKTTPRLKAPANHLLAGKLIIH